MIFLSGLVLLAVIIFYAIISAEIPGILKFLLVVVEMIVVSGILTRKYNLHGQSGLILLKSKKGLNTIEELANKRDFWNSFADVGGFISYGFLNSVVFKNSSLRSAFYGFLLSIIPILFFVFLVPIIPQLNFLSNPLSMIFVILLFYLVTFIFIREPRTSFLGFVSIFLLMYIIYPVVIPFLLYIIQLPAGAGDSNAIAPSSSILLYILPWIFLIFLVVGGMFLTFLFGIILQGVLILHQIVLFLFSSASLPEASGATLILPGINIPFFEGIFALVVVLIVHEGAHAILARIGKIPVLSSGIVLFGIIPVGAFVEPDEKKLKRLEQKKQTRVIVAGSTSNFLTSIIFFIVFVGFLLITSNAKETGLLTIAGVNDSILIKSINGVDVTGNISHYISNGFDLPKNSTVLLTTDKGEVELPTDEDGKMNISFIPLQDTFFLAKYSNSFLQFFYVTLGLIFVLNFVVATVNLLPLPFFDGYRTLVINIKNKGVVSALMYITLGSFLMNLLPGVF